MVLIHIKRSEIDQFIYECKTTDSNDHVIRELCNISNNRERLARLSDAIIQLGEYGPSKPENERGLDEFQEREGKKIEKGPYYQADPLGNRNGNRPSPQLVDVLTRVSNDAKEILDAKLAQQSKTTSLAMLQEKLDSIRGAVTMAYPMGLPENDPIRCLLDDPKDDFLADAAGNDYLDPQTSSLWWAGKEFFRDQTLGDRVGKNEKTKIVAKLQKSGAGAPAREPAVSEAERTAMMAWYFKKQEQEKALAENNEDDYINSSWADPKALKRSLQGTGNIRF